MLFVLIYCFSKFRDIRMCGEKVTRIFFEDLMLHSPGRHLFPLAFWCFFCSLTILRASVVSTIKIVHKHCAIILNLY